MSKVIVFFGPDSAFNQLLDERISPNEINVNYLDSIHVYNARIRGNEGAAQEGNHGIPLEVDNCIVRANDYGSVVSHAISNFAGVLEETYDFKSIYVQNPPERVIGSLRSFYGEENIELISYAYDAISKNDLRPIHDSMQQNVLGQESSKKALITALYRLSVMQDDSPSVVMFYGPSGVGKTETARVLSDAMGGGLTRIQFSMMQTTEAYEYLFGSEHSKASFARDLLCRESNVILIDEFDKVDSRLYNMFYQLFDEGIYKDTNYCVDMRNALFLLTTNFQSEDEARKRMGSAIHSRINAFVQFRDLSNDEKALIAKRHYEAIVQRLDEEDTAIIQATNIEEWFTSNSSRFNNMRTLKAKVEKAIFEALSTQIIYFENGTTPINDDK